MNILQIRDLAIKILGLYYLALAIISLPQILGIFTFSGKEEEFITHKSMFFIGSLVPIAMYFLVAYVLLLKFRLVSSLLWPSVEDESKEQTIVLPLATWISLIGFFYLLGSVAGAVSELYILGVKREMWGSFVQYHFLPNLITLVLSGVCIAKARQIAEYLKRKTE